MPEPDDDSPDVAPPAIRDLLILAWLLLFGGRWLLVPLFQLSGMLPPEQLATLDEAVLLKVYLVLLAVTILIVVLRAVRAAQSAQPAPIAAAVSPSTPPAPGPRSSGHSDTPSARGDNARD